MSDDLYILELLDEVGRVVRGPIIDHQDIRAVTLHLAKNARQMAFFVVNRDSGQDAHTAHLRGSGLRKLMISITHSNGAVKTVKFGVRGIISCKVAW